MPFFNRPDMIRETCCHCRRSFLPFAGSRLLATQCPDSPAKIIAETDEKGCGIVQFPVLGKGVGLASFSFILPSIRTIVALHEGGIDRVAYCGERKQAHQQRNRVGIYKNMLTFSGERWQIQR